MMRTEEVERHRESIKVARECARKLAAQHETIQAAWAIGSLCDIVDSILQAIARQKTT